LEERQLGTGVKLNFQLVDVLPADFRADFRAFCRKRYVEPIPGSKNTKPTGIFSSLTLSNFGC
jgi:hypothetical protein